MNIEFAGMNVRILDYLLDICFELYVIHIPVEEHLPVSIQRVVVLFKFQPLLVTLRAIVND